MVTVGIKSYKDNLSVEDQAKELKELALSTGVNIVDEIICFKDKPTPDLYIGEGKVEELKNECTENNINSVIFNNDLTGTQQRNLEQALEIKTIDRTQLILDIFARHAKSPEGKIQVELAQLEYLLPRLGGKGIVLSRMGGGIGTRGPGEQKLEIDRRRIKERISRLKKEVDSMIIRRQTMKKKRVDCAVPTISLVGYTSAGKSTLLNSLTGSEQKTSKHLFTTLDTIARNLSLSNHQKVVLSDTVGFIDNLPPHLIDAFKATLEEITQSELLIHVLDVSDPRFHEHHRAVMEILNKIGIDEKKIITALNKIDKLEDRTWFEKIKRDYDGCVEISALTKENLSGLLSLIEKRLVNISSLVHIKLPLNKMDIVDLIYREGLVKSIDYTADCIEIKAVLPNRAVSRIKNFLV